MGEQDQAAVGRLWRPRRRRIAEHGFYDQRAGASIARSKSSSSPGGGLHAWRTWVAAPEGAGGLSGVDGCQPRWRVRPFPGDRGIAFRAAGPALSSWRRSWPCALAVICRLGAAATFRQCQPSQRDLTGAGAARLVAVLSARSAGRSHPPLSGRETAITTIAQSEPIRSRSGSTPTAMSTSPTLRTEGRVGRCKRPYREQPADHPLAAASPPRSVLGPQPKGEPRTTTGKSGHRPLGRTAGHCTYRPLTSDGGDRCGGARVSPPGGPYPARCRCGIQPQ